MRADIKLIQQSQTTGAEMSDVSIHDVKGQSQLSHNACVFKRLNIQKSGSQFLYYKH